jgi:hypothetical protein
MIIDIRDNFCKTPSVDGFEQREMVDKFWSGQEMADKFWNGQEMVDKFWNGQKS